MGKLLIVPNGADDCVMNATICAIRKYAKHAGYETIYCASQGFSGLLKPTPQVTNITSYPINILTEGCFVGILRETPILCEDESSPYYRTPKESELNNDQRIEQLNKSYKTLNVDATVVIGGDGTLRAIRELQKDKRFDDRFKKIIGVINTMDNDISTETMHSTTDFNISTNLCLGYSSAVLNLKRRIQELDTIVRDNARIFSIETLGRDNGWPVAAASQACCEPLFLPEIPVDNATAEAYIRKVWEQFQINRSLKVAVSEGIWIHKDVLKKYGPEFKHETVRTMVDGNPKKRKPEVYSRICQQAAGHRRLGGAGFFIYMMLNKELGKEGVYLSYDNTGYSPRIGMPSMYDLRCADITGMGVGRLLENNTFGLIPVFNQVEPYEKMTEDRIKFIDLSEVRQSKLPEKYIDRDRLFVTRAFSDFIARITSRPPEGHRERELAELVLNMQTYNKDSIMLAKCTLGLGDRDIY